MSLRSPAAFRLRVLVYPSMAVICLTGCVGSRAPAEPSPPHSVPATASTTSLQRMPAIPAIRYGRYTLVELTPEEPQRDLMEQVVDITLPESLAATVGDALHYVLLRSGYQLCEDRAEIRAVLSWPLPAAHIHLGPLTLRDALQLLVGPSWQLDVNEAARQVCLVRSAALAAGSTTSPLPDVPSSARSDSPPAPEPNSPPSPKTTP